MKPILASVFVSAVFLITGQSCRASGPLQEVSGAQANPGKPRVYVTDSTSWEISGGFGASGNTAAGGIAGGARPQTAEIIKTFGERCSEVLVNNKKEMADYIVILDHEGGKGLARKRNKIAVFNKGGDSIFSDSTRSVGNSVKDACEAISDDFQRNPPKTGGTSVGGAQAAPPAQPGSIRPRVEPSTVVIKSAPDGADITVDGKYVGSTPSTMKLSPGDHTISVEKSGFKTWQRTMSVSAGGNISIDATLEKTP